MFIFLQYWVVSKRKLHGFVFINIYTIDICKNEISENISEIFTKTHTKTMFRRLVKHLRSHIFRIKLELAVGILFKYIENNK